MQPEVAEAIRIYVGGLSSSVTTADIEKTFSPLGLVSAVDFVRTKDRSLAFFDFRPNSNKAIAKLFSTYNGCTWKGGRLRVEKAKENYLTRLKRERIEDATNMDVVPIKPSEVIQSKTSNRTETSNQENMHLRIFFPKSRKIKSLPFKGTGKHKYSFQCIEVPPLPVHFCDCEEHYMSTDRTNMGNLSSRREAFERERSIMKSVMKKYVELDDSKPIPVEKVNPFKDFADGNLKCVAIHATSQDEQEEDYTDSDNLLTNIVVGGGSRDSREGNWLMGGVSHAADQELPNFSKVQVLKDRKPKNKGDPQKVQKRIDPVVASAYEGFSDELINCGPTPILAGCEGSLGHSQKGEISVVAPTVEVRSEGSKGVTHSQSRTLKSSWKELVGGMSNNSFSISNVLTGTNELSPKFPPTVFANNAISPNKRRKASLDDPESPKSDPKLSVVPTSADTQKRDGDPTNMVENACLANEENDDWEPRENVPEVKMGEACTFLRTDTSEKEWVGTKAYEDFSDELVNGQRPTPILDGCKSSLVHSRGAEMSGTAPIVEVRGEGSKGVTPSQSCTQKFSWKDFVGGTSNNSFTISEAWMGVNELQPKHAPILANNTFRPKKREKTYTEDSKSLQCDPEADIVPTSAMTRRDGAPTNTVEDAGLSTEGNHECEHKRDVPKVKTGEVCTFMRTATSEKEWAETKAALSGYLQKKGSRLGSSKSSRNRWIHND